MTAILNPLDLERADAFAARLRGRPETVNDPPDRRVVAPAAARVAATKDRMPARVPLPGTLPWWCANVSAEPANDVARLGRLLAGSLGITRVCWQPGGTVLSSPQRPSRRWPDDRLVARRPVPSGGAMYPWESYVAADAGRGAAMYRYDPLRHELAPVFSGCPGCAIRRAIGRPLGAPLPRYAIVLTHRFAKNAGKYGNFAYRLGAVDVGVALGRLLAHLPGAFREPMSLHLDFDDELVNALCGVRWTEESAYALVLFGPPGEPCAGICPGPARGASSGSADATVSELFLAMHAGAMRGATAEQPAPPGVVGDGEPIAIPRAARNGRVTGDEAEWRRRSNGAAFTGASSSGGALAAVLEAAHGEVRNAGRVLGAAAAPAVRVLCAINAVDGIARGWYVYDGHRRALLRASPGDDDPGLAMQRALRLANVDAERAAFAVHLAVRIELPSVRAYRVRRIFVGIAVDAIVRRCSRLALGSHPLLGFDAAEMDKRYGLAGGAFGVEAQVLVGAARPNGALEGTVIG